MRGDTPSRSTYLGTQELPISYSTRLPTMGVPLGVPSKAGERVHGHVMGGVWSNSFEVGLMCSLSVGRFVLSHLASVQLRNRQPGPQPYHFPPYHSYTGTAPQLPPQTAVDQRAPDVLCGGGHFSNQRRYLYSIRLHDITSPPIGPPSTDTTSPSSSFIDVPGSHE